MADVRLDLDEEPADDLHGVNTKLFLTQLRRDPPGMATDNRLIQSAKNTGIPYLAICAIGNALSGSSVKVLIRDGGVPGSPTVVKANAAADAHQRHDELREAPADHPLCRLFDYVNPNDTFEDLMVDLTIQYCLTGTAPFWFVPSKLGPPCEMYVLPTALMVAQGMTPEFPDGSWRVQQYAPAGGYGVYSLAGSTMGAIIDARQVKRFRMRHPLWRWDGYSPLTAGGVQLDVLNAIDESRKSAMDHGFNPDAVITVAGANAETLNRLQADMGNKHGGSKNARKVLFANGQGLNVENLSTNPKEMDYGSGWDQMVKYALGLFGVPPGTAGIAEATSYAQLYASLRQFYTLKMQPLAKALGSFLTKHVAKDVDPRAVIQIDVPEIDDKEFEKSKWDGAASNNAVTLNEYRGWMGLDEMPDGDRMIADPSPAQQQAEQAANVDPNAPQPGEPQTPEDAVTHSVLGMLGVDPAEADGDGADTAIAVSGQNPVEKSLNRPGGKFDENKHKRNHGKFAHTAGTGGASTQQRKPVGMGDSKPNNAGKTGRATRVGDRHNPDLEDVMGMPTVESRRRAEAAAKAGSSAAVPVTKPIPVAGLINHLGKMASPTTDVAAWAKGIKFPAQAVAQVKQAIQKTGGDASELVSGKDWAVNAAKKYSQVVGRKLGKDPAKCERALFHMFTKMAELAAGSGQTARASVKGVGTFKLRPTDRGKPYAKPSSTSRADLDALFKSEPALVEILKGL